MSLYQIFRREREWEREIPSIRIIEFFFVRQLLDYTTLLKSFFVIIINLSDFLYYSSG